MKVMWHRKRLFGAAGLLVGLLSFSPVRLGLTCGGSMAPTLQSGQPFLIDRLAYRTQPVSRGDILIFERNGINYVKRVAALQGESFFVLRYTDTGWDFPIRPDEVSKMQRMVRHAKGFPARVVQRHVPPGYCYVLGDASTCSEDSRFFGPVPLESIRGKLWMAPTTPPAEARLAAIGAPARM